MRYLLFLTMLSFQSQSLAWGKRGHEMVGSLAAQLLAKELPQAQFLAPHSFDMGYYNNAPDLVWKANPSIYKKEFTQHFIDLEGYDRLFAKNKDTSPWNPSRSEFFKKNSSIDEKEGRAPWRIEEFSQRLSKIAEKLKNKKLTKKERHQLQEEWLVVAGIMGHYVADLAQPLHVTENHDGQLTGQKGLHHWFEENVVDALSPYLYEAVFQKAKNEWKSFYEKNKNRGAFELSLELARNSSAAIPRVLEVDKKQGRSSVERAADPYKELVIERLSQGVLYLAVIWSRQLDWPYNGDRFFNFVTAPTYIEPGT